MVQNISSSTHISPSFNIGSVSVTSTPVSATPQGTYLDSVKPPNSKENVPSGIVETIMEYGKKFLENPKFVGKDFQLMPGVAFGFRVEGSIHTKSSPIVSQNAFRLASTLCLEKNNPRSTVIWSQTGGLLELGVGICGTLPMTQFVGLQGGFVPSGLLRYRTVKPHVLGFFQKKDSVLSQNENAFPFSPEKAKNLAAGSEFELSGQGRLRVLGAIAANAGTPINSWLNAGVGASAFVNVADACELSLNILALDGENKVRVTIHRISEDVAQAGAMAYAGIIGSIGPGFPAIGLGLLQGGPTLFSTPVGDLLGGYFTSFCAQASVAERSRDTHIATFDVDLSKPKACEAFRSLMKLSCVEAEELSAIKDSGVRLLKRDEKEQESRDEISASFLGDKLYLYQALTTEKNGRFTTPDGDTTIFRDAHYKQRESGWFDPTREILWESVTLKKPSDKTPKTFYRFQFQKDGELPKIEFEDYFGLAHALCIDGEDGVKHPTGKAEEVSKRVLCNANSVKQTTDLYFTPQGIHNMQTASKEAAREAYLSSVGKIRSELDVSFVKAHPKNETKLRELLEKYTAEAQAGWFLNIGHDQRLNDYAKRYRRLCGREIHNDSLTLANATLFATRLHQLKSARGAKELEAFFVGLGKSKGFRYKCVIGALGILAGEKETYVHQHEMSGNGIVFKSKDGGKIEGPSEIVTALLSKRL